MEDCRWRRRCSWTYWVSWPYFRLVTVLMVCDSIYLLNRLLHYYFYRQRNSEGRLQQLRMMILIISTETHLRLLLGQQRKQLDAIKKANNYDSTRKLIERYDETGVPQMGTPIPIRSSPSTPSRRTPESPSPPGRNGTPRAPGHLFGAGGTPGRELSSDRACCGS